MMPEVSCFEPAEALFAGAEGMDAYRDMAPELARLLAPQGRVFLELGVGLGARAGEILLSAGLSERERHKDLAGIERCGIFEFAID